MLGLHVEKHVLCLNSNFFDFEWLFHFQHVRIAKVFEKLKLKNDRNKKNRKNRKNKKNDRNKKNKKNDQSKKDEKKAINNQQNEVIHENANY